MVHKFFDRTHATRELFIIGPCGLWSYTRFHSWARTLHNLHRLINYFGQFAYHLRGMQMTSNLSPMSRYTALPRYKQKLTRLCNGQTLTILLSVLISAVFYTAVSNQIYVHYIKGTLLKSIDNFKDLGIIRSAATSHAGHYQAHYQQVITKAAQISRLIRRIFRSRS